MLSFTEENYLKTLLQLTVEEGGKGEAGTNELAGKLGVKPASVTSMLKKLKEKKLIDYQKYGKVSFTVKGKKIAIEVLRKHRLWETFLVEKMGFSWDEVHEVAEQLEHIQSPKLVSQIDEFLGYPKFDPHGDPIPDAKGTLKVISKKTLSQVPDGNTCTFVAVKDNSAPFLQYIVQLGLSINNKITVLSKQPYDAMLEIEVNGESLKVSNKFASNIYVDQC